MAKPRRNGKIFQAPPASFGWLTRMSVMAFLKQFPDDDACWSHPERVRWPDGPACPNCGNVGPTMKCDRVHYHLCKACNAKFTVAMGTPLEGTHLPMRTWFTALYLLAVCSKGLSSVALGRHLGIGQKLFLCQQGRSRQRALAARDAIDLPARLTIFSFTGSLDHECNILFD
jgi:transposase-like protein